jgi:hypothetical protein
MSPVARDDPSGKTMKRSSSLLLALLAAILAVFGCRRNGQAQEVDLPWFLVPPGVPEDPGTKLYKITGLRGLVAFGDETLAMVSSTDSREAAIRRENITAAYSSLGRWLPTHSGSVGKGPIRVPDLDDETGARFYYFEQGLSPEPRFMAICVGPWKDDTLHTPPICWHSIEVSGKVVSLELPESILLKHGDAIVAKALRTLRDDGVLQTER